jgi:O-antigen/teichoic acid export membrane protein
MLGHQRACAATFVVSLVLNIVLNLALIPQFGLIGAALATTISVGARSFALSWMVRSRLGMNIVLGIPLGLRTEAAT